MEHTTNGEPFHFRGGNHSGPTAPTPAHNLEKPEAPQMSAQKSDINLREYSQNSLQKPEAPEAPSPPQTPSPSQTPVSEPKHPWWLYIIYALPAILLFGFVGYAIVSAAFRNDWED